ncbi:MAG: hypothetical protein II304_07350 [Bacteroidales bacterium]|nr:hypothetical protein [Bacteroidales bacterium]
MQYDYQLYKLSNKFIADYPPQDYPELLLKADRPHYCLLIETNSDYFICVPFRSNIEHNNAFKFKNTQRSKRSKSGLDYSKIAIINKGEYLSNAKIAVDKDEYKTAIKCMEKIVNQASKYVNDYINHINGSHVLNIKEFDRKYRFSTLPYFHDILNLPHKPMKQTIMV